MNGNSPPNIQEMSLTLLLEEFFIVYEPNLSDTELTLKLAAGYVTGCQTLCSP